MFEKHLSIWSGTTSSIERQSIPNELTMPHVPMNRAKELAHWSHATKPPSGADTTSDDVPVSIIDSSALSSWLLVMGLTTVLWPYGQIGVEESMIFVGIFCHFDVWNGRCAAAWKKWSRRGVVSLKKTWTWFFSWMIKLLESGIFSLRYLQLVCSVLCRSVTGACSYNHNRSLVTGYQNLFERSKQLPAGLFRVNEDPVFHLNRLDVSV